MPWWEFYYAELIHLVVFVKSWNKRNQCRVLRERSLRRWLLHTYRELLMAAGSTSTVQLPSQNPVQESLVLWDKMGAAGARGHALLEKNATLYLLVAIKKYFSAVMRSDRVKEEFSLQLGTRWSWGRGHGRILLIPSSAEDAAEQAEEMRQFPGQGVRGQGSWVSE